jgi:hypothetical protein
MTFYISDIALVESNVLERSIADGRLTEDWCRIRSESLNTFIHASTQSVLAVFLVGRAVPCGEVGECVRNAFFVSVGVF